MSVNKTYLPAVDTPEWEKLSRDYPNASQGQLEIWAKELGYATVNAFITSMYRVRGLKRAVPLSALSEKADEPLVVNLPPVKIREYKKKKVRRRK